MIKVNKNFWALLATLGLFIGISSCSDDDEDPDPVTIIETVIDTVVVEAPPTDITISENITADVTWETGKTYILGGRIAVESGATLTIQPGVIVKGQAGAGANSTVLLVARGAKLMAEGTAEQPIIFTSVADEIQPGQILSPNLDENIDGLWGGLIVLGNAPISASAAEVAIEGIPATDSNGLYGGSDPEDNSGVMKYISIRHGGTLIGSGNEINGLTLGGVGSGTVIENVEVVANLDDGIEWFGGNVNVTNALVWNAGDDGLDTDQDWIGTCDNFMIITPRGGSNFELDGPEGTLNRGDHTFKNGYVYSGELGEEIIDFDNSSNVDMENIYFTGIPESIIADDIVEDYNGQDVSNIQVTLPAGFTVDQVFIDMPVGAFTVVENNANTVGADVSAFSWTWAAQSGALAELGL